MIIACERCATQFVLRDDLIPSGGATVQCSQCGHVFTARHGAPAPASGRSVIIRCEQCATHFSLDAQLIPPRGALVQCTRCEHTFTFGGPPIPGVVPAAAPRHNNVMLFGLRGEAPPTPPPANLGGVMVFGPAPLAPTSPGPAAPGALPRRDVMWFGGSPPDPSSPPAESYRSAQGRMMFGEPVAVGTQPAPSAPAIPAERQPRAPKPPVDELDQMVARAADAPEDEQLLLVLSDALMERGDARGRLMAFMLEEERGSELMRRVKVNVLIRDNERNWAPPGAKITACRRGLPSELVWSGPTDPEHLGWRSARSINVTLERPPDESVFEIERPNLRILTGLSAEMLSHVLALPPKGLRELSGRFRRHHFPALAGALGRLPQLEELTLQTVAQVSDERLLPELITSLVPGVAKLKRLRVSLPRISFRELTLVRQRFAPALDLKFLVPLSQLTSETTMLHLDVDRRALLVPARKKVPQAELLRRSLSEFLGEELTMLRV